MEREELKNILFDQNEKIKKDIEFVQRDIISKILKYDNSNLILILTGLRRVGKSTILNILKKNSKNFNFYVNFDDFRLVKFELEDFKKLNEIFLEVNKSEEFFFDEIQNINYWERYVRTLHDEGKKLFITGSNATMLSTELGTHLTGRNIVIPVYPFSFVEFLRFKNYNFKENDLYLTSKKVEILKLFEIYLKSGGIPEYLKNNQDDYLKFIYEDIINRDIVARYSIENVKSLKELTHYLISNLGKEFSYNKLINIVEIKNSTTIKDYISYLENSYLLFTINKFDYSLKKQLINPKKVYVIDNGLANVISFKFSEDRGRLLENLVFIELKRRGCEIYYHKENSECDFLIKEGLDIIGAFQVTKSLSDLDVKKREFAGLIEACKKYNLNTGLILTEDEEFVEKSDLGIEIRVKPIWKWLLMNSKCD